VARWVLVAVLGVLLAPFLVMVGGIPAQAGPDPCVGAPRAPHVDVGDGHPHATAIDCLHALGIIRGRHVDAFAPATDVRRDQMAGIVAATIEASGRSLPTGSRDRFTDLAGNVHRDAIEALAEVGIVQGIGGGRFAPARTVPRGQMTRFVVGAHDHLLGSGGTSRSHGFEDVDGHVHEGAITRAAALGLAEGRTATTFAPNDVTRRDQTARFLSRVLHRAVDGGVRSAPRWGFTSRSAPLASSLRSTMTGSSWRSGCPVGLGDLRLLETVHRGMDGRDRVGLLVLHRDAVSAVDRALRTAYDGGLRIERMRLIDRYGADDDRSMAANNSHAFNCRRVTGGSAWSEHSYGRALDLNPVQNPYVRGSTVLPSAGRTYLDRSNVRHGMAVEGGAAVRAFDQVGWYWGGRWNSLKDYQHFSANNR
jgi:hypothetical protein